MAVTTQESDLYAFQTNSTSNIGEFFASENGKLHAAYFVHDQSGAGEAGSSVALVRLPPGRVRLILPLSYLYVNWTTASATLDLGWDAYTDIDGSAVVADPDGLIDGLDVESADVFGAEELTTLAGLAASGWTKLFESKSGVVIRATSPGAIASGDDISGVLTYLSLNT